MRKPYEEVQKIANKLDCTEIYSWSRYNTYKNDPYEFYLKYILRIPEDRKDSIYAPMGSLAHDVLENFYDNKINQDEMVEKFEEKLFEYTLGGLKYDRTDDAKNNKISNKYEECCRHFFKNHQRITEKAKKELFIPIKIGSILMQGYIDFIHTEIREDKTYMIVTDWKTSSIYKGAKCVKEKGQILLYGYGLHQKFNIPLDQIVVRWAFLKYVEIECVQANGKIKKRIIERNDIGNSLTSSVKMWLKKSAMELSEDEVDNYLIQLISDNSVDNMPEDVKNKFIIRDCYVEVPLTEENIQELLANIANTVAEIQELEAEYKETKDNKIWWRELTDADSYYFANLSGYSSIIHKPYKEYLDKLSMFKDNKDDKNEEIDDDLSWLEEL